MKNIGIIGQGFVGTAVFEGLKHAFNIFAYDKQNPDTLKVSLNNSIIKENSNNALKYLLEKIDNVVFICVPTPMNSDGSCNMSIVEDVIKQISDIINEINKKEIIAVIKSTVLPGTTLKLNQKYTNIQIVFNPEFLTERAYLEDFKNQDRIILGGPHTGTGLVKQLYETAYPNVPVTKTSSTIAEMVKYITNCFLAIKISFANEILQLCEKLEIDYDKVIEYATKDKRLGTSHWSVPGPDGKKGFSGSCFPKDLNAIIKLCESLELCPDTMKGAWETNLKVRPDRDWEQLKGRAVT